MGRGERVQGVVAQDGARVLHSQTPCVVLLFQRLINRADRKSQVRQCLDFCLADFLSSMAYESAERKPKHCLTRDFLSALLINIPSYEWQNTQRTTVWIATD